MKNAEDEAFDELARKQGAWGGGFKAKQAMAADKLWDKPSVAFDEWWNGDNDESTNPFRLESGAYWAWAGWKAALAQPAQEPVDIASIIACREMLDAQPVPARVQYMTEDDDDIQDYKKPWVNLTDDEIALIHASHPQEFARALMAKLKERNS